MTTLFFRSTVKGIADSLWFTPLRLMAEWEDMILSRIWLYRIGKDLC